jgi:hypothetical protein
VILELENADRSRAQLEPLQMVGRGAQRVCQQDSEHVSVAHDTDHFARRGMPVAQSVNLVEHPGQYVCHVLAAGYPSTAPEAVEPAPLRQLVQLSQAFAGPVPEVDFRESCRHLDLELLPEGKRPGRLECPFQGAAVYAGKCDCAQTVSYSICLLFSDIIQMYSRTSTCNGLSYRVT